MDARITRCHRRNIRGRDRGVAIVQIQTESVLFRRITKKFS